MGYMLHLLVALGLQFAVESGLSTGWVAPVGLILLAMVPHAIAAHAQRLSLRGEFKRADREATLLHLLGPILHGIALSVLGWLETAEAWGGTRPDLAAWPHPAQLAGLLPFAFYTLLAIDARARVLDPRPEGISAARRLQTRMFLGAMAPLVGYVLLAWMLGRNEYVRVHLEEVAVFGALFYTLVIVVGVLSIPWLLRFTWSTVPLPPGPVRAVLMNIAQRARFECRELLLWQTGGLLANAAIIGVHPRSRMVLFSDALLARLDLREIAAVFGHEVGHAVGRHVLVFAAWALGLFLGADLLATHVAGDSEWMALLILGPMLVFWFLSFGYMSRRFELEADLYSVEFVGDTAAIVSALERISSTDAHQRTSWRHFSPGRRIQFLWKNEGDPGVGRALRRRLGVFRRVAFGLFLVVGILQLVSLGSSWNRNMMLADLRLGEYERALDRYGRLGDADEDVERVIERGRDFVPPGGGRPSADSFEAAAREALGRRDRVAALDYLELASLRGGRGLDGPIRTLDELIEGGAAASPSTLSPQWRRLLAPWLGSIEGESGRE